MENKSILKAIPEQSMRAKILNPLDSVVIATDEHLPSIPSQHLNEQFIQNTLAHWQDVPATTVGDGHRFAGKTPKQAAVLIGLILRDSGVNVVLTERAAHLRNHAGQIALPGGACDAEDADSWGTATREAQEEIKLSPADARCLGRFHAYQTVTAFEVTPWVAWLNPSALLSPNQAEVATVFEVSLEFLLNPRHHQKRMVQTPVGERTFYAVPSHDSLGHCRFIWGATAGMLRNFYHVLHVRLDADETLTQ